MAPLGNKNAVGNKGGGRPTTYLPEYAERAFKLALLGLTDKQMGGVFGVTEECINKWKKKYPDFCSALKDGREDADGKVAHSLYERATGYSFTKGDKEEFWPPDPTAMIFWLKNRQPANWRDRQTIVIEDPDKVIRETLGLPDTEELPK